MYTSSFAESDAPETAPSGVEFSSEQPALPQVGAASWGKRARGSAVAGVRAVLPKHKSISASLLLSCASFGAGVAVASALGWVSSRSDKDALANVASLASQCLQAQAQAQDATGAATGVAAKSDAQDTARNVAHGAAHDVVPVPQVFFPGAVSTKHEGLDGDGAPRVAQSFAQPVATPASAPQPSPPAAAPVFAKAPGAPASVAAAAAAAPSTPRQADVASGLGGGLGGGLGSSLGSGAPTLASNQPQAAPASAPARTAPPSTPSATASVSPSKTLSAQEQKAHKVLPPPKAAADTKKPSKRSKRRARQ